MRETPLDPHGPTAHRFPLVARPRPACLPLPERVAGLTDLARAAANNADPGKASAVFNLAALLASDIGLPDLARQLCHQHATAYLHACPLPAKTAIHALEPVVNLARLQIREGHGAEAHQLLLTVYDAVSTGTTAHIDDDITIPANLTTTTSDRAEVRAWLWTVVLADGARALTTTGRWTDALTHIQTHHGIGTRMLDGRQIAIIAALTSNDPATAEQLLADTIPAEPWETAVTACLTALCRAIHQPITDRYVAELAGQAEAFLEKPTQPGMDVFHVRLALAILDAINAPTPTARKLANSVHRSVTTSRDGYAARECLAHNVFTTIATSSDHHALRTIVDECALGANTIPTELNAALLDALSLSLTVIQNKPTVLRRRHVHGRR